jgi:putative tryptophan/tyrosine transport system substrate-binding protein
MRRREFIAGLGGAAAWPLAAQAQQTAMPVVGILASSLPINFQPGFSQGLKESGFVEGKNVIVEMHSADGQYDRLPELAAELVRRNVNVIYANGAVAAALAAKAATTTIPIVFGIGSDPVRWGLVASLNRPGANITGVTIIDTALMAKRLELIHQVVPNAAVIGLLLNPNNPNADGQQKELATLAGATGLTMQVVTVRTELALEPAFADLNRVHADMVLIGTDALFANLMDQIVALAARYRVPVIYPFPTAGGLMTYGISLQDTFRQIGNYIGRILKGEKPADLPVVQPAKVELTINLKTAKSLGLTFPLSLLGRADEVIE